MPLISGCPRDCLIRRTDGSGTIVLTKRSEAGTKTIYCPRASKPWTTRMGSPGREQNARPRATACLVPESGAVLVAMCSGPLGTTIDRVKLPVPVKNIRR